MGQKIDTSKEKENFNELVRKLDKYENNISPKVDLIEPFVDFNSIAYKTTVTSKISLKNTGNSVARWRFIPKDFDDDGISQLKLISKPWLNIDPLVGILMIGEVVYFIPSTHKLHRHADILTPLTQSLSLSLCHTHKHTHTHTHTHIHTHTHTTYYLKKIKHQRI